MSINLSDVIKSLLNRLVKKPTLEQRLYQAAHPLVATNWHGVPMLVALRDLSAAQIAGVGSMSMIQTFYDKIASKREPTVEEINAYAERHHQLLKLAMAVPTYNEMMAIAGAHVKQEEIDKQLADLRALFKATPSGKEKADLKAKFDTLELASKFLLPAEFTSPLVSWIVGIGRTEIASVTHDMLVRAAWLSEQGHDNPADHLGGNFERFPGDTLLKDDINQRARQALTQEREKNKTAGK